MNDIEKAIEHLETYWDSLIDTGLIDCKTLCECSNALEKQMPKQVNEITIIQQYKAVLDGYCPSCERYITNSMNYCTDCGQCLDWEEEDE